MKDQTTKTKIKTKFDKSSSWKSRKKIAKKLVSFPLDILSGIEKTFKFGKKNLSLSKTSQGIRNVKKVFPKFIKEGKEAFTSAF